MFWKHIQICKNLVLYVNNSVFWCVDAAFKNTGLERANNLGRDLEWFKEQGYDIPEPMAHCKTYSRYFKDIAENDPPAFICHFCNIYFAHSAGRRKIGTMVIKTELFNKIHQELLFKMVYMLCRYQRGYSTIKNLNSINRTATFLNY